MVNVPGTCKLSDLGTNFGSLVNSFFKEICSKSEEGLCWLEEHKVLEAYSRNGVISDEFVCLLYCEGFAVGAVTCIRTLFNFPVANFFLRSNYCGGVEGFFSGIYQDIVKKFNVPEKYQFGSSTSVFELRGQRMKSRFHYSRVSNDEFYSLRYQQQVAAFVVEDRDGLSFFVNLEGLINNLHLIETEEEQLEFEF